MQDYMIPDIDKLSVLMYNNFVDYLNVFKNIETIKFSIFIVVIVLVFLLVWIPYLSSLNNKIWRTKGMIKMIPESLLTSNQEINNRINS